jgi:uncharacterized damage-inducible protein DinB
MSSAPDTTTSPALALAASLGELAALLEGATDVDYLSKPSAGVSGSVGAHVRHCLDHVEAVLDGTTGAWMTYDERRRDTPVEHDRALGVATLRRAVERLSRMPARPADEPLTLEALLDRDGLRVQVRSSLGRELVFVLQHTLHHQALIALLLAGRGLLVPPLFGYAPSTKKTQPPAADGERETSDQVASRERSSHHPESMEACAR